jgi:hypothetical protein
MKCVSLFSGRRYEVLLHEKDFLEAEEDLNA